MGELTLRKIWPDREADYVVICDDLYIGRIVLRTNAETATDAWIWEITIPLPMPDWAKGSRQNYDDARADFQTAWKRFEAQSTPAQMDYIRQRQQAIYDRAAMLGKT
jgi:hypothetical protein